MPTSNFSNLIAAVGVLDSYFFLAVSTHPWSYGKQKINKLDRCAMGPTNEQ